MRALKDDESRSEVVGFRPVAVLAAGRCRGQRSGERGNPSDIPHHRLPAFSGATNVAISGQRAVHARATARSEFDRRPAARFLYLARARCRGGWGTMCMPPDAGRDRADFSIRGLAH